MPAEFSESRGSGAWVSFSSKFPSIPAAIVGADPLVIECDENVYMDASPGSLIPGLIVKGHLHFEDSADVSLSTWFIINHGLITAGSALAPHQHVLDIELVQEPDGNGGRQMRMGMAPARFNS